MTLEDLKSYFINGNQFEAKTGLSHVNWHNWFKKKGYIPIGSQRRIEKITQGALKASLEDLPDGQL
jgi:hypothetical protein